MTLRHLKGGWIVGNYLSSWLPANLPAPLKKGFRVLQDILPSDLAGKADILLPSSCWAETTEPGRITRARFKPYAAAVPVPEGIRRAGDVYYTLVNRPGLYKRSSRPPKNGRPLRIGPNCPATRKPPPRSISSSCEEVA